MSLPDSPDSPDSPAPAGLSRGARLVLVLGGLVTAGALVFLGATLLGPPSIEEDDAAATAQLQAWKTTFETYREQNGAFPELPDGGYCLGTGYPVGTGGTANCRDYRGESFYTEEASAPLREALGTVGDLPTGIGQAVNGTVGPWVLYQPDRIDLLTAEQDFCAEPATDVWSDDKGRHVCMISLDR
ncbi:MAG: hypothetical protein FJW64_03680 [Actinobacteria bacterium]|nr:hypothetical protein [Actinomycetota bacterium]